MLLKTVLNRVHKVKGFVYQKTRFDRDELEVEVRPRRGSPTWGTRSSTRRWPTRALRIG